VDLVADLVHRVEERRGDQARFAVAIDGPDAAGKTTLANALSARLGTGALHVSMDAFHHLRAIRHRRGRASAAGYFVDAFDHATAISELLVPFRDGAPTVRVASTDYDTDVPVAPTAAVGPRSVLVVDGVFLQIPLLRRCWDFVEYLRVSPAISTERGMARDALRGDNLDDLDVRYRERYLPGQARYRAEIDPESAAALLVDRTDPAKPFVVRG
jgi:uridine kinase